MQRVKVQRVTVQRATVIATDHSATSAHLSLLNEERRHIAGRSATGNLFRSIQRYICNIYGGQSSRNQKLLIGTK